MKTQRTPIIRPMESYMEMADGNVLNVNTNVVSNMLANTALFPNPPVPLAQLKTNGDNFSALMAESTDGSRKVIAQKNNLREIIITDLRLLGRYVEKVAGPDMATFKASGFEPAPSVRTVQVPLSASFRTVDHGSVSGQMIIRLKAFPNALCYELQYAAMVNRTPGQWTTQLVTSLKKPTTVNGLTPGTVYAFQSRYMDRAGYSDWSDSVTYMCI